MWLILFDCDGTLVDSQAKIVRAMTEAFHAAGLEAPTRQQILGLVGRSLPQIMIELTKGEGPVEELIHGYRSYLMRLHETALSHEPLYEGTRECLNALSACENVLLGVATGKSRRGLEAVLDAHDLARYFVTLHTADDAPSKPNPTMVYQALGKTGVSREKVIMIGDTSYDMEMAKVAGIVGLGVMWGYHNQRTLQTAGACEFFENFVELQTYLMAKLDIK